MVVIKGPKIQRELLSDKVTDVLRRMILTGELPVGTHLVEDDLARQLGTSRAPLREALGQLGREGLVAGQPGRGTHVKGFTAESIRDLFAVRTVLEVLAAELAAARIGPTDARHLAGLADAMEAAVREGKGEGYVGFDLEIHRAIWRASGNERLVEVLEDLVIPVQVFVNVNAEGYHDWPEVVELHRRLVAAVASRDKELAANTMRDHQANAAQKALAAALRLQQEAENPEQTKRWLSHSAM